MSNNLWVVEVDEVEVGYFADYAEAREKLLKILMELQSSGGPTSIQSAISELVRLKDPTYFLSKPSWLEWEFDKVRYSLFEIIDINPVDFGVMKEAQKGSSALELARWNNIRQSLRDIFRPKVEA